MNDDSSPYYWSTESDYFDSWWGCWHCGSSGHLKLHSDDAAIAHIRKTGHTVFIGHDHHKTLTAWRTECPSTSSPPGRPTSPTSPLQLLPSPTQSTLAAGSTG